MIDVHLGNDGHVIVMHDDFVDRTTDAMSPLSRQRHLHAEPITICPNCQLSRKEHPIV
ncbi:MAG: glycerophosphodiester phosphodiesterase family protein [bacterium]